MGNANQFATAKRHDSPFARDVIIAAPATIRAVEEVAPSSSQVPG
jgi:hypothetical protein